jgi:hypothetical protein
MELKVGQLWKDNDPRQHRVVRIMELPPRGFGLVAIQKIGNDLKPTGPRTYTRETRFGRKAHSGFTLVQDVSAPLINTENATGR